MAKVPGARIVLQWRHAVAVHSKWSSRITALVYRCLYDRSMPGWNVAEHCKEEAMLYRFEDYTLDTQCYELRYAGVPCHLEPQVCDSALSACPPGACRQPPEL